jgi:hypothetical protein
VFTIERLDLGAVVPGTLRVERVRLRNQSDVTLRLVGTSSSNPGFALVFTPGTRLGSNDLATLTVHHSPARGAVEPLRAQLRAWTEEGPEATLEVTSVPITPGCELPEWIEFGPVRPGDALTWELPLQNSTSIDTHAEVELSSATGGIFEVERGRHPIASGRAIELPISFRPGFTAEFSGSLMIRPHALCPTQRIGLFGTGVIALVEPAARIMFWSTKLGVTETLLLPLRNHTFTPVSLFDPQVREGVDDSDVFRLTRFPVRLPAAERAADGRLIPGEANVEVSFTPTADETRAGRLTLSTDLAAEPLITVDLAGHGIP